MEATFENNQLRLLAEKLLKEREQEGLNDISSYDEKRLIHELQTYQVELEIQKEEVLAKNYEIEKLKNKYQELYEFSPVGYISLSRNGEIEEANIAALRMLGLVKPDLVKKKLFHSYIEEGFRDYFFLFLKRVFGSKEKKRCELKLIATDGSVIFIELEGVLMPFDRQKVNRICFAALIDITERKLAQTELLKANEELELKVKERTGEIVKANSKMALAFKKLAESEQQLQELNESKDKFFWIVSHDIKSPLAGLKMYASLLSKRADEISKDELKQFLGNVDILVKSLDKLVNNFFTWAAIQNGAFEFKQQKENLTEMVFDILNLLSGTAKQKDIKIVCQLKGDVFVYADQLMVKSILNNLITNAIKFTHSGGIINITTEENDGELVISVSDNGLGMSEKVQSRLFKIDEASSGVGTANERGSGLGLVLVKEFVEKNGGRIWFESSKGKGSKFSFSLIKWQERFIEAEETAL